MYLIIQRRRKLGIFPSPRGYIKRKKSEFPQVPEPRRKLRGFPSLRNMKKYKGNMRGSG